MEETQRALNIFQKKNKFQVLKKGGVGQITPYTEEGGEGCPSRECFVRRGGERFGTLADVRRIAPTDKTLPVNGTLPFRRDKEIVNIHGGYIGRG